MEKRKQIEVQVNLYLELINSILLTSRYNEITMPFIGYGLMTNEVNEYTDAIKSYFKPYRHHEIYAFIEELIPNGFLFSRPVELALSLTGTEKFRIQYELSELCVNCSGGMDTILKLVDMLQQFSQEIDYFTFFENNVSFYAPYLERANAVIRQIPFVDVLEEEYGRKQNSYHFVISSLMRGNYGIQFENKASESADLYAVFTTDDFSLSPAIVFHEYSHPFINPLTEKYKEIAETYSESYEWLKQYKLPGFQSGYGDLVECINEHLVRAMTIHLLRKNHCDELAEISMNEDTYRGYQFIPAILEKYSYYDEHRAQYCNLEEFYPKLLEAFSCFDA